MKRALIGYSGFVGSTINESETFTDHFNSSNFQEMRGRRFDEIVCAGVTAVKWRANMEPEQDWQAIQALIDVLATVETQNFTLISTIDVYPDPEHPKDETFIIPPGAGQPYGRHRLAFEAFVRERFETALIARLPGLFGRGLKKNLIFDLLTHNQTDKINPAGVFQWYFLGRLASDLSTARQAGLFLVNLFPEPVPTSLIIERFFPDAIVGAPHEPAPRYQLETIHSTTFGGSGRFLTSSATVLNDLEEFVGRAHMRPATELR